MPSVIYPNRYFIEEVGFIGEVGVRLDPNINVGRPSDANKHVPSILSEKNICSLVSLILLEQNPRLTPELKCQFLSNILLCLAYSPTPLDKLFHFQSFLNMGTSSPSNISLENMQKNIFLIAN
jgi:hypothetical protein